MNKYIAEFIGTAVLVLIGCGAVVFSGVTGIGFVGIAFAFGLAIVAIAYGIGPISGAHVNPAVTLAALIDSRISLNDAIGYWIGQFAGGLVGALILLAIAGTNANGLGQTTLGADHTVVAGLLFEIVFTAIFTMVILGSTGKGSATGFAGLAIGLTLTAIHLAGIPVTGSSLNPARSFGPALLVGGDALSQVWLYFVGPLIGGAIGGALFRFKILKV